MRGPLLRRCLHVALGGGAFLLPLVSWQVSLVACTVGAAFNALVLPRMKWVPREDGAGTLGLVLYPLVLALLLVFFRSDFVPVQAAWICMAVGDGLAPLLAVQAVPWPWNRRKSVVGSVCAYAMSGLVLMAVLPWPLALCAALAGCLVESLPLRVDDNLLVPLASALAVCFMRGDFSV